MKPAVFLDRDGTLIEEVGYLDRLDRLAIYPWSVEAVRLLNDHGFHVIVVTNQGGVAQGFFDEAFVQEVHDHLDQHLRAGGARIDRYYYCPHHPEGTNERYRVQCECRKPESGLVRQAEQELDLDLSRSYVVGDRWSDVQLGQAIGAGGILVRSGYGETAAASPLDGVTAAAIVPDLMAAVNWILRQTR